MANYAVTASLVVGDPPEQELVLKAAEASAQRFVDGAHKLNTEISLSGLYASLHVAGVQKVNLSAPAADIAARRRSGPLLQQPDGHDSVRVMTLLPPNRTPLETDLDQVAARMGELDFPIRDLWSSERCPKEFLPWLAWALSVDEWDAAWPVERKREAVQASVELHRRKGTVWAVREALRRIGYKEVDIQEGVAALKHDGAARHNGVRTYSGQGEWFSYVLTLDLGESGPVTAAASRLMRAVAERYAPESRRLDDVRHEASMEDLVTVEEALSFGVVMGLEDRMSGGPLRNGAVLHDGSILHSGPKPTGWRWRIRQGSARYCDRDFQNGVPEGGV